ncbi:MAG: hypothetical protein LBT87_10600, partial [Treponema sp.]|nr:hypothetical protein [Treponema sp.]
MKRFFTLWGWLLALSLVFAGTLEAQDVYLQEGHRSSVEALAWSPDGTRMASAGENESGYWQVKIWDMSTGRLLFSKPMPGYYNGGLAWNPDGTRLAAAVYSYNGGEFKIWDAESGEEVFSLKGRVTALAWSPDGRKIAAGAGNNQNNQLIVLDTGTGRELLSLRGHGGAINSLS